MRAKKVFVVFNPLEIDSMFFIFFPFLLYKKIIVSRHKKKTFYIFLHHI